MITHQVQQGSQEWHALRAKYHCASDAAAMLGLSKRVTRSEYLRMRATGDEQTFSAWVQSNLLDRGHAAEESARAVAEVIMGGEDLYPVVGSAKVDGLNLLASFDGLTMGEDDHWEHKLTNQVLIDAIAEGDVPDTHWPQIEHQLIVRGGDSCVFTVGDGTDDGTVALRYVSRPERRARVLAGWKQFQSDLESYVPQEVIPATVAAPIKALPALVIQMRGEVTESNLALYRETALAFVEGISTDLQTDQDFANAEKTVTFCDSAEKELKVVKAAALAQTASIDQLFRAIDEVSEALRSKRLALAKLVECRKTQIRDEILLFGKKALQDYVDDANRATGQRFIEAPAVDFAGAMKGKRTVSSLRNAVDAELLSAKASIDSTLERVRANLALLDQHREFAALFADAARIVLWEPEQFSLLVTSRIAAHKKDEADRLEREREKIRAEEAERADREAMERAESEERGRIAAEAAARRQAEPAQVATRELHLDTAKVDPIRPAASITRVTTRADATNGRGNTRATIDALLDSLSPAQLAHVHDFVVAMIRKALEA